MGGQEMSNEKGESKRVVLKINVSFRIILRASLESSFIQLTQTFRLTDRFSFELFLFQIKYRIF